MSRVSHMVLPVADLQQSRNWYVDKLGFKVERELKDVVGIKDDTGLIIFLWQGEDNLAGRKITLTIEVDDVEGKYQELQSSGVEFVSPPKVQFWGYGAEVLDPDGYINHLWDSETISKAIKNKR
jgi:catechol 2,3-dioxygenase-like lactoylglutathione lyase family enzyme